VASPEILLVEQPQEASFTDKLALTQFSRGNAVYSGCLRFKDKQLGSKVGNWLSLLQQLWTVLQATFQIGGTDYEKDFNY
jgi:hypothetical protein